jgi:TPP-dependent pyruvate/acetoin dehydrogenase alpha subunit
MRGTAEMTAARRHDPVPRFARYLRYFGVLDVAREAELTERAQAEVTEAVEFASHAAPPPVERAFKDVYATDVRSQKSEVSS